MAETMKCFLHTSRDALVRCKQCGKPLCHECRVTTDMGIFCSQECYQRGKSFTERAAEHSQKKSSYWAVRGLVRKLIGLVIILAIIWALWQFGPASISGPIDSVISTITGFF